MAIFNDISKELGGERNVQIISRFLPIFAIQIFETEMKKIGTERDQLARRTSELNARFLAHEGNRVEINNRIQNALKKFQLEKARTKNIQKEISKLLISHPYMQSQKKLFAFASS